MTDPELWDQFRSGDREALAALHQRHRPAILRATPAILIRLVKSAEVRLRIIANSDRRLLRAAAVRALIPSELSRSFEWPHFDGAGWQRSDDLGNLKLDCLAPGNYPFEFRAERFPPRLLGPFVVAPPSTEIALALANGASTRGCPHPDGLTVPSSIRLPRCDWICSTRRPGAWWRSSSHGSMIRS